MMIVNNTECVEGRGKDVIINFVLQKAGGEGRIVGKTYYRGPNKGFMTYIMPNFRLRS